jgi:hypothetical protein
MLLTPAGEMPFTEVQAASHFSAVRFFTTDVRKASVYLFAALRMIAKGRYSIPNVSVPIAVEAY